VLDSRLLLNLLTEIEVSLDKRPAIEIRNMLEQAHDCAVHVDRRIRLSLEAAGQPVAG
jgi:hypothetical protein